MSDKNNIMPKAADANSEISKRQNPAELADMAELKSFYKKNEDFRLVGTNYHRVDAELKVTGKAKYTGDITFPDMLHGKFLRSPHPHAKIVSIDISKAEAIPGVKCVITGADFKWGKIGNAEFAKVYADKSGLAQEKVRFVGEEVVAVAAVDENIAAEAVELIKVEYEPLAPVFDAFDAMNDDAPPIHAPGRNNIGMLSVMKAGNDVEDAFAKAYYTDNYHYKSQRVTHCAIEPHAAIAKYSIEDDEYTIWTSTQSAFVTQFWCANVLGVPESKVRIVKPYLGGGFGGKLDTWSHEVCAALLAKRTGKPVRIVLTREEVFACSKTRHEIAFDIQSAFSKDGTMLAKKCVHVLNGGSYGGSGIAACAQSLIWANLPYKIPAVDIVAKRVYTNNISGGAMRGYGSCQVHFANEVHMDAVANAMGIDPVDLRRINGATPNYDSPSGLKITSCAFKQTLDAAEEAIHWKERKGKLEPNEGVGFAGSGFVSGTGFPILETPKYTSANVLVRLNRYGYGCVYTGSNDIGQGSDTVMTLIAAEELGLDMNEMKLVQSDTSLTPFDSGSYGSRVTFLTG
ncbi:MAG: molybdopterin-dependent oxidoreductase, partial [Synergistaceae bacterium]|nr:molybdopterin-dependent oxidoreductase [Synergistaceae bacterium]